MTTPKKATASKKAKGTKAEKATKVAKAAPVSESKAAEVIAPVPVALLEAHPSLPSTDRWLALFADHYTSTAERHAAIEAQNAPPPEPEPVKRGRAPLLPPTLPGAARPIPAAAHELSELSWATEAEPEAQPEPEVAFTPEPEAEAAPAPEPEVEFDLFAQLAAEEQRLGGDSVDPDDFLARLQAQGEAAVDGRPSFFEEDLASAADPSSPFITAAEDDGQTTTIAVSPSAAVQAAAFTDEDEGQTTTISAFTAEDDGQTTTIAAFTDEDDGQTTTIAAFTDEEDAPAFADPGESTTMIAAISDEDLANLGAPAPAEDAAAAKPGRKSRKASKKKKG